jgi:hypothetical protein
MTLRHERSTHFIFGLTDLATSVLRDAVGWLPH